MKDLYMHTGNKGAVLNNYNHASALHKPLDAPVSFMQWIVFSGNYPKKIMQENFKINGDNSTSNNNPSQV